MNKTILITGASSGIGLATARLFAAKGWNVIATMRDPEAGSDRLRYFVGDDARGFIRARDGLPNQDYIAFMRSLFPRSAPAQS